MKRITHATWAAIQSVLYLGLMTNLLLAIGCLPALVLLVTTDPRYSWPLIALAVPFGAPAAAAAFATFRESAAGENQVVRPFLRAWRALWRKALVLGVATTGAVVVLLVDVRALSDTAAAVVVVPMLGVLTVVALGTGLLSLVALAEAPTARLRDILRASLLLGVRRWYLTALTLVVLALQAALFTVSPAFALGLTAAPALYVAWANSRFTLRPVLDLDDVAA